MTIAPDDAVVRLAAAAGVMIEWVDAWGRHRSVSRDTVLAVVGSMTGLSLGTERQIIDAERTIISDRPDVSPVIVAWDGVLPPVSNLGRAHRAMVVLEDGREVRCTVRDGVLETDERLPLGYHRLVVDDGRVASHVFAAPRAAYPAPTAALGLVAPVYSLRSNDIDHGIGTLRELRRFGEFANRAGVDIVGTLPLLPVFTDTPSPYSPVSRRMWNETFADLGSLEGWGSEAFVSERALVGMSVDYDTVTPAVGEHLRRYSDHVMATPRLADEVETFVRADPEIARYAEFRAVADAIGHDWRRWPASVDPDPDLVAYHRTVQWVMQGQVSGLSKDLRSRGQLLYLDLPIGCHPDGYDVWVAPDLYATASVGAPPDELFEGGQVWGLPAPIPQRMRSAGHLDLRRAIRHHMAVAGVLRMDHVMALHRSWWVPPGAAAQDGAYVQQPVDDLFAVVCIEAARAGCGVIGENLGTVPTEIREQMRDHDIAGMTMALPDLVPPSSRDLVALSSHDTPTFVSWWQGEDIDDLVDLGVFDADHAIGERLERRSRVALLQHHFGTDGPVETMKEIHRWMARSDAAIALVNVEDIMEEHRRQNVPGTFRERPNWTLRHRRSVENLGADEALRKHLLELRSLRLV